MSRTWEPSNKSFQGKFREFQISHENMFFFGVPKGETHPHTCISGDIHIYIHLFIVIYIYNTPLDLHPTYPTIHFCCCSHDFLVSAKKKTTTKYAERTSGCGAFAMATLDVHHHSFGKTQATLAVCRVVPGTPVRFPWLSDLDFFDSKRVGGKNPEVVTS